MKNRELIEINIKPKGYAIGCFDSNINNLEKSEIKKVFDAIEFSEHTDVNIIFEGKKYVVEVSTVDNEMDFLMISREDYISRYGRDNN